MVFGTQTRAVPVRERVKKMKVNTDLKSGNAVTDAANLVNQGTASVAHFFSTADRQARTVTNSVTNAVQSAWNSLTGWIKL